VSVWAAAAWGAFSSGSLFVGAALTKPLAQKERLTAQVMAFGAGTLLSAVAYELVPEASFQHAVGVGSGFLLGAVTYFVGDRLVDHSGGDSRQQIAVGEAEGSGAAMFLGALLDGIPEAFILGISFALGGSISIAFIAAIFISNIPQGIAGTSSLEAAGYSERTVYRMWGALTIACAVIAALGFLLAHHLPAEGLYSEAFAAGAIMTMLADSMMPEAFEHGGKTVGLVTVFGYLAAAVLSVAQ
jgi:zinc transporter, ZIP family